MNYVPVSFPRAVRLVWRLLDEGREQRPTVARIAGQLGVGTRHLRRAQYRHHSAPWRRLITYGRVTYALREINHGVKLEAAIRAAGLHNRTNFYKQVREYFDCLPNDFLGREVELPLEVDLQVEVESTKPLRSFLRTADPPQARRA